MCKQFKEIGIDVLPLNVVPSSSLRRTCLNGPRLKRSIETVKGANRLDDPFDY